MKSRFAILLFVIFTGCSQKHPEINNRCYSGIYPHLASYNNEGECGTGAVVPWSDHLWLITYGPHLPFGSSDKLYEITPGLEKYTRPESTGGTHANRFVHRESKQLFIGPYVIDSLRNVRVIPFSAMPGRLTGNARHIVDPEDKIYFASMEEGFYEVDVKTLEVKTLFQDGNVNRKKGEMAQYAELLPGAHGKGLYSGQGVLVYSNNGEATPEALEKFDIKSGVLAEWDGSDWKVIRRNQFVEVTGPGGIYGNANPTTDPIWATGWDHKSLILGARENGKWSFYRLPKASHSYDGAHGWNTEWPRIRDVGSEANPDYLMTMHGMFWHFPGTFSFGNSAGIRPGSAYLKVIGDFARWNNRLVFGCDDSAQKEFLNKRKTKGNIEGPGQSNSNLWFTALDTPDNLGPNTAEGSVWLSEPVSANMASDPFLFAGWDIRTTWIKNEGNKSCTFNFEIDETGNNRWKNIKEINLKAGESTMLSFNILQKGEWIRVISSAETIASVHFSYTQPDKRSNQPSEEFNGISEINEKESVGGLLWSLGNNRRSLGILAGKLSNTTYTESGYYELDSAMCLLKKEVPETSLFIREKMSVPRQVVSIEESSVLIIDDKGRRWRLPKSDPGFDELTEKGLLRICREVATERDLFNCMGTFYELPAENADGFAKIRPIASHLFRIHDYASYRGLLILTGLQESTVQNNHIIRSADGKAAVWAGTIDDLWKLGKPVGRGGPWSHSPVKRNIPSDPYLIGFYDHRTLEISHNAESTVTFSLQADPVGNGSWMNYAEIEVKSGETFKYIFPPEFQSRWIRFASSKDCCANTFLRYE
jgi:hypothetical protein